MRPTPERALPWIVGAVIALLYAATLSPGLSGGDAGELTLAAHHVAVAHPPGYPAFVLLGHVASWLPVGPLSVRLNLFSALCGAGAAAFLAAAILRLTRSAAAALFAAGLFALAPLSWTWSTRTEVFALADLLAAALLWAAASHATAPTARTLARMGLLSGLALTNHHTAILLVAPLAAWAAWRVWREPWRNRGIALGTLAGVLGLLPYLALPIAAKLSFAHSWGEAATPQGFWQLLTRGEYGSLQLAAQTSPEQVPRALSLLARESVRYTLGVGLVCAALAFVTRPALAVALGSAFLLSGPGFLALARFPLPDALHVQTLQRFFLLPALLLCALAGLGFLQGLRRIPSRWRLPLASAAVLVQGVWTLTTLERQAISLAEAWARAALRPLPPDSVLLMRGDLLSNALRYAQEAEGLRPDVSLVDLELLTRPWHVRARRDPLRLPGARYFPGASDGFSLAQLVAANPHRPFFVVGELKPGDPTNGGFRLRPDGLAQRLLWAQDRSVAPQWSPPSEFTEAARAIPNDAWDAAILDEVWEAQHRVLLERLRAAIADQAPGAVYAALASDLEGLIARHPGPAAAWFKNLGIAHGRAGDTPRMRAALQRYLELAPDAPDRALIREQLR